MKNKIAFAIIVLLAFCNVAGAQNKITVTGVVKDDNGEPLAGAAIVDVANRKNGTITDEKGCYKIVVPKEGSIEISFLTFKTAIELVSGRRTIDVTLVPDNAALEATVVIGYGTSKKVDLTGSVATVDMDEIKGQPVLSVAQSLEGRVAGAEFSSTTGEVGESTSIRIRGSRSISASNEPLIVVDGVVDAVSDLNEINPSDIVSISVLKDVSSTAIYGSRGANGVILVTTQDSKRPEGKFNLKFRSTIGYSGIAGTVDIMNAEEYAIWRNMCAHNNHSTVMPYPDPSAYANSGTDWIKTLSQNVITQDYYLALIGSVGKTSYAVSVGYNNTPGIIINSGASRLTGNVTLKSKVSKSLTFNLTAKYSNLQRERANCAITGTNTSAAIYLSPLLTPEDTWNKFGDGESYGGVPFNNPYLVATNVTNHSTSNYFLASPSLLWTISPTWSVNFKFSANGNFVETGYYSPSTLPVATANNTGGTAKRGNTSSVKLLEEITATYKKKVKNNNFDLVFGMSAEQQMYDNQLYSGTGYTNDALKYYNIGSYMHASAFTPTSYNTEVTKLSAFGRFSYDWKKRYYVSVSARADGSSNFAENHKWGFFPAAAFRWSIMNENWLKSAHWLNDLSLRFSIGRSGNDAIKPYMSLATLTSGFSSWIFGDEKLLYYAAEKLSNSNLTWETTDALDLGINFSAWRSRVNVELDGYLSYTKDLLMAVRNTQTTGFNTYYSNGGETRNTGVELTIDTQNIVNKNFTWTTTLTVSHNTQIVTAVGSESSVVPTYINPRSSTQYMYGYKKGYPVNSLWGYQYEGVWHNEDEIRRNELTHAYASQIKPGAGSSSLGQPKYADVNHDGILDENDVVYLGSADPVVFGGFQNTFKIIQRITVGIYFAYSIGGYIYNIADLYAGSGTSSYNKFRYMLNAWTEGVNTDTDVVKAGYDDFQASSKSVYDASYLRLKTLSISYDFLIKNPKKSVIKECTLGITGDNLFLIKNYPGFDPDVNTSSSVYRLDNGSYPRTRTVALNVYLKF